VIREFAFSMYVSTIPQVTFGELLRRGLLCRPTKALPPPDAHELWSHSAVESRSR